MFANRNYIFIFDEIMKIYRLVVPNLQQRINNIVELISDIRDPNGNVEIIENESTSRPSVCFVIKYNFFNKNIKKIYIFTSNSSWALLIK